MVEITENPKACQEKTTVSESSLECSLAGAVAAISGLNGSAVIVHGPPGCGWTGRWARSDFAIDNYIPLVADNLLQHNLIFGASDNIISTMQTLAVASGDALRSNFPKPVSEQAQRP